MLAATWLIRAGARPARATAPWTRALIVDSGWSQPGPGRMALLTGRRTGPSLMPASSIHPVRAATGQRRGLAARGSTITSAASPVGLVLEREAQVHAVGVLGPLADVEGGQFGAAQGADEADQDEGGPGAGSGQAGL